MAVQGGISLPVGLDLKNVDGDIKKLAQRFKEVTGQIDVQVKKVDELKAHLDGLESGGITAASKEVQKMQSDFDKVTSSIEKTKAEINSIGGQLTAVYDGAFKDPVTHQPVFTDSEQTQINAMNAKLDQLEAKLEADKQKAAEMGEALKTATGAATQAEIEKTKQKLAQAETKLESLQIKAEGTGDKLKAKMNESSSATVNITSGLESMTNKILGMAKRVFVFSMITKALRNVRGAIGDVIMSSPAMQASLENLTNAFYVLVTPIYEAAIPALTAFVNTLAKVVVYTATFIYSLMGKSYRQLINNSKALKKQVSGYKSSSKAAQKSTKANKDNAKSVKEVNKELASFDELLILQQKRQSGIDSTNPISGGGGSGGVGGGIGDLDIDEDKINVIESIGKWAREHKKILLAAAAIGALCWIINKLLPLFEKKDKGLDTQTPKVEGERSAVKSLSEAFQKALFPLAGFALGLGYAGDKATEAAEGAESLAPALEPLPQALRNVGAELEPQIGLLGDTSSAFDIASEKSNSFENALNLNVMKLLELHPEMRSLIQETTDLQQPEQNAISTTDNLTSAFDTMGQRATDVQPKINTLKSALSELSNQSQQTDNDIQNASQNIANNLRTASENSDAAVKTASSNIDTNTDTAMSNAGTNIKTFETNSNDAFDRWRKATNGTTIKTYENADKNQRDALSNINENEKTFAKNSDKIWIAVGTAITGTAGLFLSGVCKKFIDGLTAAYNVFKSFSKATGGKEPDPFAPFGDYKPSKTKIESSLSIGAGLVFSAFTGIPALARGAVIPPNREFLAILGDQKRGTNIEAPLDTIKQAVAEVMQSGGYQQGGNQTIILELDGREVGRTFGKAITQEANRVGNSFVKTKLVF